MPPSELELEQVWDRQNMWSGVRKGMKCNLGEEEAQRLPWDAKLITWATVSLCSLGN